MQLLGLGLSLAAAVAAGGVAASAASEERTQQYGYGNGNYDFPSSYDFYGSDGTCDYTALFLCEPPSSFGFDPSDPYAYTAEPTFDCAEMTTYWECQAAAGCGNSALCSVYTGCVSECEAALGGSGGSGGSGGETQSPEPSSVPGYSFGIPGCDDAAGSACFAIPCNPSDPTQFCDCFTDVNTCLFDAKCLDAASIEFCTTYGCPEAGCNGGNAIPKVPVYFPGIPGADSSQGDGGEEFTFNTGVCNPTSLEACRELACVQEAVSSDSLDCDCVREALICTNNAACLSSDTIDDCQAVSSCADECENLGQILASTCDVEAGAACGEIACISEFEFQDEVTCECVEEVYTCLSTAGCLKESTSAQCRSQFPACRDACAGLESASSVALSVGAAALAAIALFL